MERLEQSFDIFHTSDTYNYLHAAKKSNQRQQERSTSFHNVPRFGGGDSYGSEETQLHRQKLVPWKEQSTVIEEEKSESGVDLNVSSEPSGY